MSRNLYKAISECRFKQVKLIADTGLDLSHVRNKKGENALVVALRIEDDEKRERMFRNLARRGATCDDIDKSGKSVMMWTCILNRPVEMEIVMNETVGAVDFSHRDQEGYTVLHYAVFSSNPVIVRYLVRFMNRYGLSVDVLDRQSLSPYVHAKRLAYYKIAEILEKDGGASILFGDARCGRSVGEWEKIGKYERHYQTMMDAQKTITQYKIHGRLPKLAQIRHSLHQNKSENTWPQPSIAKSKNVNKNNHKRHKTVGFFGLFSGKTRLNTVSSYNIEEIMHAFTDSQTPSYRIPVHQAPYTSLTEEQIRQKREQEAMMAAMKNPKNRRGKKLMSTSSGPNTNNNKPKLASLTTMTDDAVTSSEVDGADNQDGKETEVAEIKPLNIDKNNLTVLPEIKSQ